MKVATPPIEFCVSCHALYTGEKKITYVDFEVYYDGPLVTDPRYANEKPTPITDLIVCEKCLINAGKLIGLVNDEDMRKENKELGELVDEKNNEIIELNALVSDYQKTNEKLIDSKIQRPARKPRIIDKEKAGV